jgi:hypothetical protein
MTTTATTVRIPENEVKVGDSIMFLTRPHLVTSIEDYPTCPFGPARIARSYGSWGYTLLAGDWVEVAR